MLDQHPGFSCLARFFAAFAQYSGRAIAWLLPVMVVLICLVVVLRYAFNSNTTLLHEVVLYLHASLFLLGASHALYTDSHVRVDVFYRHFSVRQKAWINAIGSIVFLLPFCVLIVLSSWDFVLQSWQIKEVSVDPSGLPFVYLLKALLPLSAIMLMLQAVAEVFNSLSVLVCSVEDAA